MLAVEFDTPERRSAVVEASLDRGLLTLGCGTKTIRLLPRSTRPNAKSRALGTGIFLDAIDAVSASAAAT